MGVEAAVGETPRLTGEFIGETHMVLELTQTHRPGISTRRAGPMCLWVVGEVTENWQKAQQVALLLLRPLPHIQSHNAATWVALPW